MALIKEQCEKIQEKLTAAGSPEEIAEIAKTMGCDMTAEDAAALLSTVKNGSETDGKLDDEALKVVNGGEEVEIPQYQIIRDYYREKGPNLAFVLCIYYIPSPICYEIIQVIENQEGPYKG